jgi:hypothetical protein
LSRKRKLRRMSSLNESFSIHHLLSNREALGLKDPQLNCGT